MAANRRTFLAHATALALPTSAFAQVSRSQTLVVGTTQRPRHLNSAVLSGVATMLPAAQLFASLFRMDRHWKPQPYLAQSWQFSPDYRSLRVQLRNNALFHDGRPIRAEDVEFSVKAVREHHPFKTMMGALNGVTIESDTSLVLRFGQPHPAAMIALGSALVPILPKHIFGDGRNLLTHPRNTDPVGSGPFRLTQFRPGDAVEMERFDKFFLPGPTDVQRLVFKDYRDPTVLLLAFERGEVDIHQGLVDPQEVERLAKRTNVYTVVGAAPALGALAWLAFNLKHPVLSDRRVRQAINYAIDKNFIVDKILKRMHIRSTGPIGAGSPMYSADVQHFDFNPARASQLLDQAGHRPGADGVRFKLDLDCIPGLSDLKAVQEHIKLALAKVGVAVNLRAVGDFPSWATRVASQSFDFTLDVVFNWGDPVIGVHRTWLSSNIKPGIIWSNTQSYDNKAVDKLLDEAAVEFEPRKRKALYAQVQKTIVEDVPVAFLYELNIHEAYSKKIVQPPQSAWGLASPLHDLRLKPQA